MEISKPQRKDIIFIRDNFLSILDFIKIVPIGQYFDEVSRAYLHRILSSSSFLMGGSKPTKIEIQNLIYTLEEVADKFNKSGVGKSTFRNKTTKQQTAQSLFVTTLLSLSAYRSNYLDNDERIKPFFPSERPAPIRVHIEQDRIALTLSQNRIGKIDYASADRIRESLYANLSNIIKDLPQSSNVDRRYVSACSSLLNELSLPIQKTSIESLGLHYQLVDRFTKRIASEIGIMLLDEIQHTLTALNVLLNQFQEWKDYLHELSITQFDSRDSTELVSQTYDLIALFEQEDAPVQDSVVQRLRNLVEPITKGIIDAEAMAVPLVGSLSNIFSLLSQIAVDNAPVLITSEGQLAVFGGTAILANFAASIIKKFYPTLSHFPPFNFVLETFSYVSKFYSQIKDVGKLSH